LQATLLGIAVAIILALVAALVGPYFVDWNAYRGYFEAEAAKVVGQPVRIAGPIDARLLPTPALTLGNIEIGAPTQPPARMRELHAELALGQLVRGELRASELHIAGLQVSLGLTAQGAIDWPATRLGLDPDRLQIDRVEVEDSRLTLGDAASGAAVELRGFWFKGEMRSLLGPAKGEGGFMAEGERYGYRVAASRVGDDGAVKLKLGLDPVDQPIALETEGALRFEQSTPHYDGTLTLARIAALGRAGGRGDVAVPWRATAKVKAAPTQALFEQIEYQYGPDERAIRLTGTAEMRFGRFPALDGVLSARQVDLDRALALPEGAGRLPVATLKALIAPLAASYRPSFPVKLGIGIDAMTLAGGTLQAVRGDLKLVDDAWDIETLEFRAPGVAQVRLGGRIAPAADEVTFSGPAQVEASNPRAFIGWLEGRAEAAPGASGSLRASGDLTIGAQQFSAERLKFEIDRKTIQGRLAYAGANGAKPPRLDAELKAAELDVDSVLAFARAALEGTALEKPRAGSLVLDIGRATLAGIDVKGISGTLKLDPEGLTFDHVRVADLADATFGLNGRMEGALDTPRGTVTFDIDARSLDGTAAVLERYLPQLAPPLRHAAAKITPLKTQVTLGIAPLAASEPQGASRVKLAMDGTAGALRMKLGAEAAGDIAAVVLPDYQLDAQVSAADGGALIALLGLDRAVNVDKRAGLLSVTMRGRSGADAQIDARLTAGGFAAAAKGTARLFGAGGNAAALDLTLQASDASPLRRGAAARQTALLPATLRARLAANAQDVVLDGIVASLGGTPLRGRLKLDAAARRIEGQIDAEAADLPALVAIASGMGRARGDAPAWSGEPFGDVGFGDLGLGFLGVGALGTGDLSGKVDLTVGRATLAATLAARQMRGVLRFGAGEVALENVEGTLANGRATGELALRQSPDGLVARGRIALASADAAAMLAGDGRPAIAGRLGLQAEFEGSGLSPASLIGSLKGTGLVTLEDAQLSGLDPKAFGAAVRAADQAAAVDAAKIRDVVVTVLDGGALMLPRLDAALTIDAGQARLGRTVAPAQGADLVIAGAADLADASVDARLTLSGPKLDGETTRPEILVTLKGPPGAVKRNVDVAMLAGVLTLRAVERQSRQIDLIEAERRDAERREAERKEAERRDAERREAERKDAERKEAERRDAERRASQARVAPAPAGPQPVSPDETTASAPVPSGSAPSRLRPSTVPQARPSTPAERAPALPAPLNIGPAPGTSPAAGAKSGQTPSGQLPRQTGEAAKGSPPPPAPRSALDLLFGVQR
jgi:large subunit ribosomal protein L24